MHPAQCVQGNRNLASTPDSRLAFIFGWTSISVLTVWPELFLQIIKIWRPLVYCELLLVSEINRVRGTLFNWSATKDQLRLPEPCGPVVTMTEKLFVPLHEHPDVSAVHFCTRFIDFCLTD